MPCFNFNLGFFKQVFLVKLGQDFKSYLTNVEEIYSKVVGF